MMNPELHLQGRRQIRSRQAHGRPPDASYGKTFDMP